jgi:HK97 gp10 family phage protein
MDVTVKIEGLEKVQAALTQAGPRLVRSTLHKALAAGGQVFLEAAQARCPVLAEATANRQPGELRDAIAGFTVTNERRQSGLSRVGLKYEGRGPQDPGVYGLFVEFGTKNMAARPYMRPAFDTAQEQAAEAFIDEFRAAVQKLEQP